MTPLEDRLRAGLERAARVRPATDEDRALLQVSCARRHLADQTRLAARPHWAAG